MSGWFRACISTVLVFSILSSSPAYAKWVLTNNPYGELYFDDKLIIKQNDYVIYWELGNDLPDHDVFKHAKSIKRKMVLDCARLKVGMIRSNLYSKKMGRGTQLDDEVEDRTIEGAVWSDIEPGDGRDDIFKFLCK